MLPGVIGPAIGAAVLQNADTIVNSDGIVSFPPNNMIFLAAFAAEFLLFAGLTLMLLLRKKSKTE